MSRLLPLIAAFLLAGGAILVVSLRSLHADRDRLLQGVAAQQLDVARDAAADLRNRLQDLDEDGRLLRDLVSRTRMSKNLSFELQNQTLLSSFEALATIVRAYRSVALVKEGAALVMAIDRSDSETTRDALLAANIKAAAAARGTAPALVGPLPVRPGKDFYFHVARLGDLGAVVIAVEPRRLLAGVLRPRSDARQAIQDPEGHTWMDCAQPASCRLLSSNAADEPLIAAVRPIASHAGGAEWLSGVSPATLQLPGGPLLAAWSETDGPTGGSWRVLLVASAASERAAMSAAAARLFGVAAGLVAAMAAIGSIIVWQQRRAAILQERIRHIERVQSLEDQLIRAEKLATTGVLAAGIAHEIGTPLSIIRGRAELLLEEPQGSGLLPGLASIIDQIDQIARTIGQVLDFSRGHAVMLQPVSVEPAVHATLALLEHRFRRQGLVVETDLEPNLPPAAADPAQLQQVLVNLLMNACDACAKGGKLQITVATEPGPASGQGTGGRSGDAARDSRSRRLRWTVRDTGSGIDPSNLRAVFDPFFTTKKRGEGTGLGLSVVASIVRNHEAEITLSSELGRGTTVTLLWPIARGRHHAEA